MVCHVFSFLPLPFILLIFFPPFTPHTWFWQIQRIRNIWIFCHISGNTCTPYPPSPFFRFLPLTTLSPPPLFISSLPYPSLIHLITSLSSPLFISSLPYPPYSSLHYLIIPLIHLLTTFSPSFIFSLPYPPPYSSPHYLILPLIHLLTTFSPLFIYSLPYLPIIYLLTTFSPLFISSLRYLPPHSSPHYLISPLP